MFENELTEQQLKAIELLSDGETMVKTAELVGCNRKSLYNWKSKEIFMNELNRRIQEKKNNVEQTIINNIPLLSNRLIQIAIKSKSDKTSLDAIEYCLNRILGTPTNKTADVSEGKEDNNTLSWDDLDLEEFEDDTDNVINIKDVK